MASYLHKVSFSTHRHAKVPVRYYFKLPGCFLPKHVLLTLPITWNKPYFVLLVCWVLNGHVLFYASMSTS